MDPWKFLILEGENLIFEKDAKIGKIQGYLEDWIFRRC